jgi:hypothetical protein
MRKLKIATLHCFGSNARKHAEQKWHFVHCAAACAELAEFAYPEAPNRLEPQIVYDLLKNDMRCAEDEVTAFGFEDPRCWFRFTDGRYEGLRESMACLTDFCRKERPDGIAGYSNGGGAALLVAAAREAGNDAFQSIRFVMSFAGATSQTMQRHIREYLGPLNNKITIPAIIFGSRHDPMLASADQMAAHLFERCNLAISNERRPFANHALPDKAESYIRFVDFLTQQLKS